MTVAAKKPKGRNAKSEPTPPEPQYPASAEAPRIYNLFPLLVGRISAWRAELPRIAAMGFNWVYVNPLFETGPSRSLYAIRDPFRIDARFRDPDGGSDLDQIRTFVTAAETLGLRVMADLVISHTARNALLVERRYDIFRHNAAGEIVSPGAADATEPGGWKAWEDLAELDYYRFENRDFLVRYFDEHVAWLQSAGIAGFRCDAAYKVPSDVWTALIGRAKKRDADCLFAAETLGCTPDQAKAVAASGFDYLFNSFAWWDFRDAWALEQYGDLRLAAPSIAFPENHDTARLAAAIAADASVVADALVCHYALAAAFSAGVLMPIGYEWAYRKRLHVADTTPEDWEDTGIDISSRIAAINATKAKLAPLNVEAFLLRITPADAPYVAFLRLDSGHRVGAREAVLTIANPSGEPVTIDPAPLLLAGGGGFGPFRAVDASDTALRPAAPITLRPFDVRFYRADALAERKVTGKPPAPNGEGRVVIEGVSPEIDGGRAAAKRVAGEVLEVFADIFSDGHEIVAADLLYRRETDEDWSRTPMRFVDNDRWSGRFAPAEMGVWRYTIEAWRDRFASYRSEIGKKRAAGRQLDSEASEGIVIVERAAKAAHGTPDEAAVASLLAELGRADTDHRIDLLLAPETATLLAPHALRENVCRYPLELPLVADRLAARFSAWYELFPRSAAGDGKRHGTFDDVIGRLPYVRDLGFDVLYFPPIHPVGTTNRKGKNNTLTPAPDDVGSVYAIGSPEGGHDAIHPQLGTIEDFRRLVAAAHHHGIEIALDFAIQCSPDHPWIKEHREWFDWRPDGTIKFAENPPKRYEDIVNVEFYEGGLPGLWYGLYDAVMFWVSEGVKIFRVDNPHTKPIPFWEWLIREVNLRAPDVIFLAEAFTRPKMMKRLAKAGFQQSYTYFTWRNTKAELIAYSTELAGAMGEYYRPNFFANTPDINPFYLQTSGRAGFVVRAALAATLSSVWGIYSGFEICEATPLPGREEYLDAEKYELKAWDFDRPDNIKDFIRRLNVIRRDNPALWDFRNVLFLNAWNDQVIAYARMNPEKDNCILVLVNLDPHNRQEADYEVPLWLFGLPDDAMIEAEDLLTGGRFTLHGKVHRIALDPADRSVVIWRLVPPAPQGSP